MTWEIASVIIVSIIGVIVAIVKWPFANDNNSSDSIKPDSIARFGSAIGEGLGATISKAKGEVCPAHSGMVESVNSVKESLEAMRGDLKQITMMLIELKQHSSRM